MDIKDVSPPHGSITMDGTCIVFGLKDINGDYAVGTWRLCPVGNNMEWQRLDSNGPEVWTMGENVEPAT